MKLRRPTKDELKAKAKKYAPHAQAAISIVMAGVAAYYMRENNGLKKSIDTLLEEDENAWPMVEVTPNCFKEFREGSTLALRMYHTEDPKNNAVRDMIQMTTREGGFPEAADEAYAEGKPGEAPRRHI